MRAAKQLMVTVFAVCLVCLLASPALHAQEHVVSPAQLQQATRSSAAARTREIHQVESFFASKPVQKAVRDTGFNLKQVQQAIPTLSNQELAQLSRKTHNLQNNFAAGALTHTEVAWIIGVAAVVVIILAIKA